MANELKRRRPGFTLIEVVTTIFIISLLLLIMLPNISHARQYATQRTERALAKTLETQYLLYKAEYTDDTASLSTMQKHGYLTEAQVKHILEAKIPLPNGLNNA